MEPFDIDRIIKQKLSEGNSLHQHSSESAKPFVWASIQRQVFRKSAPTWYHLTAAVILLTLIFSCVFYELQRRNNQEIAALTDRLNELQSEHHSQRTKLVSKEIQFATLVRTLKETKQQLKTLQDNPTQPTYSVKTIIRTDTVHVPLVKSIANAERLVSTEATATGTVKKPPKLREVVSKQKPETDDAIFMTSAAEFATRPAEKIKVRFGPFASDD